MLEYLRFQTGEVRTSLFLCVFEDERNLCYFQLSLLQERFGAGAEFRYPLQGQMHPVEVKANDGNAKRVKTILKYTEKYHVDSAIKLADLNVGRYGKILTLPLYMAFLLVEK